jgi:cardiolipin synthase A/B
MHSKIAVIDQDWSTIGSSNLDPFSLLLALEANVIVRDTAFAKSILEDVQRTIQTGGQQITAERLKKEHAFCNARFLG